MRTSFYPTNDVAQIVVRVVVLVLIAYFIDYGIWYYAIRVDKVKMLTVRTKTWAREIKELHDYTTYEMVSHSKEECSGTGRNRRCTTTYYWTTEPRQHTRTINTWDSNGEYPTAPFWPEHPALGAGNYTRNYESYNVVLSDDGVLYNYNPGNESYYNTFPVSKKCLVGFNWPGFILKVEC